MNYLSLLPRIGNKPDMVPFKTSLQHCSGSLAIAVKPESIT